MSKLSEYLALNGMAIDEAKVSTRLAIVDYLKKARDDNGAYLALESPTAAERNKQINKLTRQNNRVMRLLLNNLTGDD